MTIHQQLCTYPLKIQVFDGLDSFYYYFNVTVTNHAPYYNAYIFPESVDTNVFYVHVNEDLDAIIPLKSFADLNILDSLIVNYEFVDPAYDKKKIWI